MKLVPRIDYTSENRKKLVRPIVFDSHAVRRYFVRINFKRFKKELRFAKFKSVKFYVSRLSLIFLIPYFCTSTSMSRYKRYLVNGWDDEKVTIERFNRSYRGIHVLAAILCERIVSHLCLLVHSPTCRDFSLLCKQILRYIHRLVVFHAISCYNITEYL